MKKFLCILIMAAIFFPFVEQVYAIDDNSSQDNNVAIYQSVDGDLSLEEGAQEFIITSEDRLKSQERLSYAFAVRTNFPSYTELDVPWFQQQNSYYCGPATVKQVLHYINGISLTQDQYAQALGTTTDGTDMTCIPSVLNASLNNETYAYDSIGTSATWLMIVRTSLYDNRPAILDIKTTNYTDGSDGFPYSSSGHFVNVSGYNGVSARVRITDPNDPSGTHWYPVSVLYGANNDHWRKAIIWQN